MPNPIFNAMGGGGNSLSTMLQQLKANPVQFLMQRRFNIPASAASDPNAIIQHLVSSGQVSQDQINRAYQAVQRFGR